MILDIERRYPIEVEVEKTGCWKPISHKPKADGRYYQVTVIDKDTGSKKNRLLHRFVYEELVEPIPEGAIIRHSCDNVFCINPEHLSIGTHQDNSDDMVKRGRSAYGERNGNVSLSDEEVEQIRDLYNSKRYTQAEIGQKYSISQRHVSNIVRQINR